MRLCLLCSCISPPYTPVRFHHQIWCVWSCLLIKFIIKAYSSLLFEVFCATQFFFCYKYNRVMLWSLWWFWLRIRTRKRQNDIFCNENKFYVQKGGWCVSEAPFYDITISYCNFDTCSHLVCLWSWSTTTRLYDTVYIADIILSMRDGVIIKRIILWATLHGNGL